MNEFKKNTKKISSRAFVSAAVLGILALVLVVTLAACHKNTTTPTPTDPTSTGTPVTGTTVPTVKPTPSGIPTTTDSDTYLSPSSVSVDGEGNVYVSDATRRAVTKFSSSGKALAEYKTDAVVTKVLYSDSKVYVLEGELDGKLTVLSADLKKESQIDVGHTPNDIVIVSGKAYVSNRFDNAVGIVDLSTGKQTAEIAVEREPRSMVLVGKELYVGCFLTGDASNSTKVTSKVAVIDTATNKVKKEIELTDGSQSVLGLAASPDGSKVYVTHLISRYTYPTTQLDRGWINTNGFTVIDTKDYTTIAVLLDELELGAPNPWDVACSADGKTLYFTISGTHEIMTVDVEKLDAAIKNVKDGKNDKVESLTDIEDYIPFLDGAKKRYKTGGNGLRDMVIAGDKLYVAQYFSGDVAVVNLTDMTVASTIAAGEQPESTAVRLGESLWYDGNYCYQQWESCASCHPDARADALNWDNLNDGLGNPKNTKSMLFSHRTPPVMITGARVSAELAVRKGMLFIQYNVLEEEKLCAIDEYLKSLLPTESPYLNRDGSYTEAALAGKKLFEEVGCAKCHPAPLYTDLKMYKSPYLGQDGTWENREFVTPTLVEIWRSAPYTYFGGTTDIKDVINKFANRKLTDDEVSKIAEFVLSIGIVDEKYGVEQVLGTEKGETIYCKIVPGTTIDSVSVRKQFEDAPNAKVSVKLVGADGKEIASKEDTIDGIAYNTTKTISLGFSVPSNLANGSYLEVTIKDTAGNDIASVYKLTYTG